MRYENSNLFRLFEENVEIAFLHTLDMTFEIGGDKRSDYFRLFSDNELMQTIIDEYLRAKFERTVILWENVCIDESLHRSRKRNRQLPGDWNDRFSGTNTDENLPKEKP